eukprot:TRINITY_DN12838_c0_g1_i2.p1 TRINITY_DN12838_c0_g1~~TRINITY_DN12838_c0_g1_i2.p1  ORF type:complete len:106 (-),score=15.27 TRINITY_DN12838_c0_g1_i2:117-434(-)
MRKQPTDALETHFDPVANRFPFDSDRNQRLQHRQVDRANERIRQVLSTTRSSNIITGERVGGSMPAARLNVRSRGHAQRILSPMWAHVQAAHLHGNLRQGDLRGS